MSGNTPLPVVAATQSVVEPAEFFQVGNEDLRHLRVYLRYSLFRNLDEFALRNTSQEQAGLLLGHHSTDGNWTLVHEAVELKSTDSTSLSDGVWREARKAAAKRYPNLEVVGWFHSHPGTSVGIQPKEVEIHTKNFGEPWQVVYVMDPVVRERGFYLWDEKKLSFAGGFRIFGKEEKEEQMAAEPARPDEHLRERYLERSMDKVLKTLRSPANRPIDYVIVALLVLVIALELLRPTPTVKVDQSAVLEGQQQMSDSINALGDRVKAVEEHLSAVGMLDAELELPKAAAKEEESKEAVPKAEEKIPAVEETKNAEVSAEVATPAVEASASPIAHEAAGVRSGAKVIIHKVNSGDTISTITEKYYKTADPKICKALGRFNNLPSPRYDHIVPGDTLKIPAMDKLGV